jgi:mRNA interferase HigB
VASLLPNSLAVFKFKGNDYCLVVIVRYTQGLMFVRFVDTHA